MGVQVKTHHEFNLLGRDWRIPTHVSMQTHHALALMLVALVAIVEALAEALP